MQLISGAEFVLKPLVKDDAMFRVINFVAISADGYGGGKEKNRTNTNPLVF